MGLFGGRVEWIREELMCVWAIVGQVGEGEVDLLRCVVGWFGKVGHFFCDFRSVDSVCRDKRNVHRPAARAQYVKERAANNCSK